MIATLEIVLPVFALIAAGYLFGVRRWFAEGTAKGLADFTFTLAVPALLFRTVATNEIPALEALMIWSSYFGALAITFALAVAGTAAALRRPPEDGASIAMSSTYGNVVMLGVPIATSAFGSAAGQPIAVILSLNTPLMWLAGTLYLALVGSGRSAGIGETFRTVVRDLARNPIIISVVAGTLWRLTGLGLAPVADRALALLAQASVPCALVALGLGLVSFEIKGQTPTLVLINVLKLLVMPVAAAILAYGVFRLDPVAAGVVVLFAAMPTGANAFLFANKHGRAMNSASGSVALGTALSALTAAAIVFILPR